MSTVARIATPLAAAAATVLAFDVIAYLVLPPSLTAFATSYRKPWLLERRPGQPAMTRGGEPRNYFVADPVTGFEIGPGARGVHDMGEASYEIFANSLGCFDRNEVGALRAAPEYQYFGGDSFTWGFAEYASKFATVWEQRTGKVAAKCGVPHTGQAHQLAKLERVARAVGKFPSRVFVGWYVNDPANDAAYPHTTVIAGYQADTVFDKDGELVRADAEELRRIVEKGVAELEAPLAPVEKAKAAVWVYSLSANIAIHAVHGARWAMSRAAPAAPDTPGAQRATAGFGSNLYYWHDPRKVKTDYAADPKTAANRAAIARWAVHAREHGYQLVFLLFPPGDAHDDPELFGQVRRFLEANGIEHLDFARLFRAESLERSHLYWRTNGHWSPAGNRVVGRLLAERYR